MADTATVQPLETTRVHEIAKKLSRWHMLDLNLVHEQGFMRVGDWPAGKTGELIDWGVLEYVPATGVGHILRPTRLFLRVRKAAIDLQKKTSVEFG